MNTTSSTDVTGITSSVTAERRVDTSTQPTVSDQSCNHWVCSKTKQYDFHRQRITPLFLLIGITCERDATVSEETVSYLRGELDRRPSSSQPPTREASSAAGMQRSLLSTSCSLSPTHNYVCACSLDYVQSNQPLIVDVNNYYPLHRMLGSMKNPSPMFWILPNKYMQCLTFPHFRYALKQHAPGCVYKSHSLARNTLSG